ncbi:hypothetical protein J6590_004479 [Homalodisca vitripennis]|nr:hypothetical protein J6590_004479 [Homalodisca vitripennis]
MDQLIGKYLNIRPDLSQSLSHVWALNEELGVRNGNYFEEGIEKLDATALISDLAGKMYELIKDEPGPDCAPGSAHINLIVLCFTAAMQ